jgi:hypothetical protein
MTPELTVTHQCHACGCFKTAPAAFTGWLLCQCGMRLFFAGPQAWRPVGGTQLARDDYDAWDAYDAALERMPEATRIQARQQEIDKLEGWWAR